MTSTDYENPYRPLPIRMFNWMGRAGLSLGISGRLDVDSLIANARRTTGLTDLGEDRSIRALEVLVESINDEARLTATGRLIQKSRLGGALVQRLRIEELLRRHPEIHDIALGTIVLVTGLQRTGTTLLQRLLNAHPEVRGISGAEVLDPASAADPEARGQRAGRRRAVIAERAMSYLAPQFQAIHPISHEQAEEDILLLDLNSMTQSAEATMHVPSYSRWLEGQDHTWPYEHFRAVLKALCWQRPGRALVLKTPHHMEYLDVFLRVFPEATVVQTHRDPRVSLASYCSMVAHARGVLSDHVDPGEIGTHWFVKSHRLVQRSMEARERAKDRRFIDVSYYDLTRAPIAELRRVCEQVGVGFDSEAEREAGQWMEANPQNRFGTHTYRLGDFGLSEQDVDEAFASYREKHAIPIE